MSNREHIDENIKRKLYAESMGRCMNPNCQTELFNANGDIIEKAHIVPYCKTKENTYENLIILCPNCHTKYDKNELFTVDEVKGWKQLRKEELERVFCKKFHSFDELKAKVVPLLLENKSIYENYYLNNEKALWDKFEPKILINNRKLKELFKNNLSLFQSHPEKSYSNLNYIQLFLTHVEEFESTRRDDEKNRAVLFPKEINSMFGIAPIDDSIFPLTESLERLIEALDKEGKFESINIGIEEPYILIRETARNNKIFLTDTPRLRQLYYDYKCFRRVDVRLDSLNFALKYIRTRDIRFEFVNRYNLRKIKINNTKMIFVYEYCLSKMALEQLSPEENYVIVNLHNWNGKSCISKEAYIFSELLKVSLLTMDEFYVYINSIKSNR